MRAADFFSHIRDKFTFERVFILIFLIALFVRLYNLDLKLFHHDEAIHAWFSYRLLEHGIYQYDPMYHGPLLYHITAGMFALFGDSDLVARIVPALLGALLIPLVYFIYKLEYLDKKQTLIATFFIAISPNMVYFSRFLRNDIFILFFTLALLVALLYYFERKKFRYALVGALALAGGMCTKENMPIVVVIFVAYILYLIWKEKLVLPLHWKRDLIIGAVVVTGIMALFYSSFGQHPEILMDGWIKAIEHWTAMHQQQRLGGPPYIYILLFLLYELPILLLAVFGTWQFINKRYHISLPWKKADQNNANENDFHETVLKCLEQIKGLSPASAINKNEEFTRFCIFWMICSLAAYGYIGEKVPWLILHQLLPMIFVAVYMMTNKKVIIALITSVFLVVMMLHVAFTPADINEPIVQVQNSEDLRDVMSMIDASDSVGIATTDHYWPLPWYYRGERGDKLSYLSKSDDIDYITSHDFDMVIDHDTSGISVLPGYDRKTVKLSYWFSIYDNKGRLPEYYFRRDGKVGSINWNIFTRSPEQ